MGLLRLGAILGCPALISGCSSSGTVIDGGAASDCCEADAAADGPPHDAGNGADSTVD